MSLALPKPTREPKQKRYIPRSNAGGRLIARAERACSRLAEKRADGFCEFCAFPGNQTQHFYGKQAHPKVRFDGRNLAYSCDPCHRRGEKDREWLAREFARIVGTLQLNALSLRTIFGNMDDPREVIAAASAGRFLIEREGK